MGAASQRRSASSSTITSPLECVEDNEVEVVHSEAPTICVAYNPPSSAPPPIPTPDFGSSVDFDSMANDFGDQMLSGGLIHELFSGHNSAPSSEVGDRSGGARLRTSNNQNSVNNNNDVQLSTSVRTPINSHRENSNCNGPNIDEQYLRNLILNTVRSIIPRSSSSDSATSGSNSGQYVDSSVSVASTEGRSHHIANSPQVQDVPTGQGARDQDLLGFAGASSHMTSQHAGVTSSARGSGASGSSGGVRASLSAAGSVRHVPAIPQRFITRIQRGEFVCFHSLYSAMTSSHREREGYSFSVEDALEELEHGTGNNDGMVLSVRPRRTRARIEDYTEWMRTWNEFLAVLSHYQPHLLPQLFRYQAAITRFAERYENLEDLMAYDAACRRLICNNPMTVTWDDVIANSEIYDIYLRNAPVKRRYGRNQRGESNTPVVTSASARRESYRPPGGSMCWICGRGGHISRHCPAAHTVASQSSSTSQSPSVQARTSNSTSAFRAPQRPCYPWNDTGVCNHVNCRWAHRCSLCNGNHPRSRCNNRQNRN